MTIMTDKKEKTYLLNSVRWKAVTAAVAVCAAVCIMAAIAYNRICLGRIAQLSKIEFNQTVDSYTGDFEKNIADVLCALQSSAEAVSLTSARRNTDGEPFAIKLMSRMLSDFENIKSAWVISEPYMLNNSDSLLINTNPGFPIGWYGKLSRQESRGAPEYSGDLQTCSAEIFDLYRKIKTDKKPKISSPDAADEINTDVLCIIPLIVNDKFAGVMGVDIDTKQDASLMDIAIPADILTIIADNNGKILYSRKKNLQNKNISEIFRFTEEKLGIMSKTAENIAIDSYFKVVEQNNAQMYIHNKKISLPGFEDCFVTVTFAPSKKVTILREQTMMKFFWITLSAILLFTIIISILSGYLAMPIEKLKSVVKSVASGNFDIESDQKVLLSSGEFASLYKSILRLAGSLKLTAEFASQIKDDILDSEYKVSVTNNSIGLALIDMRTKLLENRKQEEIRITEEKQNQWATGGHSRFSDILRNNISDIHKLCNELIDNLVPYIDVNQGGIFIRVSGKESEQVKKLGLNPEEDYLELFGVFAYGHERFHKRIVCMDEGLIGACAMEKHYIVLNNVPDNYMDIGSGLGKAKPGAVLFVPLVFNDYLYGVLELASFKEFKNFQIEFVNRIAESAASTIANAQINKQTSDLLQQSQEQSKSMRIKEEELRKEIDILKTDLAAINKVKLTEDRMQHALNRTLMTARFTPKGDTSEANRKFTLRYMLDINDIKRKNIYEIFQLTLSKYDEFKKVWDNVKLGSTETYVAEIKVNNSVRKIKNTFVPVYDVENKIESVFCISSDITNEAARDEELEKLKKIYQKNTEEANHIKEIIKKNNEDIEQLNKELSDIKKQNAETRLRFEKASSSAQFFKRELEKRISKFRKIEASLKEKVHNLENKLNNEQETAQNDDAK